MLNNLKFFLPNPWSNYIIVDKGGHKECIFIYRLYLFKNITMLNSEELSNYFGIMSSILKNTNIGINTILGVKESSAVDYVDNIKKLILLAEKTDEEVKRLILLSQVDLILKKIGEHKNYFYLIFNNYYTNDDDAKIFYQQKVYPYIRQIETFYFHQELIGAELVGFFNELFLTKPNNKIYINENNIKKVFINS